MVSISNLCVYVCMCLDKLIYKYIYLLLVPFNRIRGKLTKFILGIYKYNFTEHFYERPFGHNSLNRLLYISLSIFILNRIIYMFLGENFT